ncbi:formate dehydrogenase subunit gamma [Geminicoccus roseus]|uniref:formate dehydrogenase subunit gamma n=1 Tax=Geminicoccus roseus TaxID=404900 RepID=UPI000488CAC9|nr:formate dehydrogenase subunit gamma [Geminicoccus roseus]
MDFDADLVRTIALELKPLEGPLLPILHALVDRFGFVDERAIPVIADVLNLSRADVHGVASFYHDFRHHPAGQHVIKVCRAEACQSMGSDGILESMETALGIRLGQTTPDGRVTLEPVYCLGLCATAPAALVDGEVHGRLDPPGAAALAREARA